MTTVIIFLLVLSVLVLVHEWGHFITAKKSGCKVYEFGIGFPPRLGGVYKDPKTGKWHWVWGSRGNKLAETVGGEDRESPDEFPSTLYSINWLPIGGFVKIKGENGEEADAKDSFGSKKIWQKLVILVAGVFMNVVLAGVLLSIGFMIGLPTDITDGYPNGASIIEDPYVVVGQVVDDSPAKAAGLEPGDRVLQLDDTLITKSSQMISYVDQVGANEISVLLQRGDEEMTLAITPEVIEEVGADSKPRLGLLLSDAAILRYPWHSAIYHGFRSAVLGLITIFIAFYILLKGLIFGQGMAFDVTGPVGIAKVVGSSARMGVNFLINTAAMISLSLAAINILPIPALDGGRALFVIIEGITRKPVPKHYEQMAHTIGFVLLMILILVVTVRDVIGLVG